MDEYRLSDDPIPQELLEVQESLSVWNNLKVYFDNDTGEIFAISNEELPQYQYSFNVHVDKVRMLVDEKIDDYKVAFDSNSNPTIILKPKQDESSLFLIEITDNITNDSELIIEKNIALKKWIISLRSDKREEYLKSGVNTRLEFFIVDKDHKNFLIRKFTVLLKKLYENNNEQISFVSYREEDNSAQIYTKKFFTSIGLKITYDKKN